MSEKENGVPIQPPPPPPPTREEEPQRKSIPPDTRRRIPDDKYGMIVDRRLPTTGKRAPDSLRHSAIILA